MFVQAPWSGADNDDIAAAVEVDHYLAVTDGLTLRLPSENVNTYDFDTGDGYAHDEGMVVVNHFVRRCDDAPDIAACEALAGLKSVERYEAGCNALKLAHTSGIEVGATEIQQALATGAFEKPGVAQTVVLQLGKRSAWDAEPSSLTFRVSFFHESEPSNKLDPFVMTWSNVFEN